MRWVFALMLLLGIVSIQSAKAAVVGPDGNDLHEHCASALAHESGARAGLCLGFVSAFRQLALMLLDQKLLCAPATTIGNEQFIKVLVKYLDQHPEKLHLAASQLVYDAMQESFPCSNSPK